MTEAHILQTPSLLLSLQKDCSIQNAIDLLYSDTTSLDEEEIFQLYKDLRGGGVNLRQVRVAISKSHATRNLGLPGHDQKGIRKDDVEWLLKELDRRYFILKKAVWDFALLDRNRKEGIGEKDALFLFQQVQGEHFSWSAWQAFLDRRENSRSLVRWEEIEIPICEYDIIVPIGGCGLYLYTCNYG